MHPIIYGDIQLFSATGPAVADTLAVDGATSPATPRRQKPFLSNRANNKTYSQYLPELINNDDAHNPGPQNSVAKKEDKLQTVVVDNRALEQRVENLSVKIAQLTALIMAQKRIADAEEL